MPRYPYVLLDADRTLYDFDAAEDRALRQLFAARGWGSGEEEIARYKAINQSLWDALDRGEITRERLLHERFTVFLRETGRGDDPAACNREYLALLSEGSDLLPGAEEFCRKLAAQCTLAIVTNGVASAQRGRFGRSPLRDVIPWLFISEEVGWSKPRVEFFAAVLERMDIWDKTRAVVMGDSLVSDIGGGNAAGLDTIWYNPAGAPRGAGGVPTWEVRSYARAEEIILAEPYRE